jgi:maleylacetate reductase
MPPAAGIAIEYEALPGRVRFGAGALSTVPEETDRLGARRVVLIDGLLDPSLAEGVARALGGRHAATLTVARQHVPAQLAEQAGRTATDAAADCLLSIGGGSSLGVAKAVALRTGLPIVAVPTTYAGSEMTPIWGVTADGHKTTGHDLRVLPAIVVYDPELTVTLSASASGASGMNAVAHCVEALWTERRNPVTDAIATEAIGLLAAGLRACVRNPTDIEARDTALRGAWLAGTALAVGGTALHHKICHVLGGTFDLPHAEVHAAVLPWVVECFRYAAPDALRRVARALGADDAVTGLQQLAVDLGATSGLAELGLNEAGADAAAETIAGSAPARPMTVSGDEVRTILERAMVGPRPMQLLRQPEGEGHG